MLSTVVRCKEVRVSSDPDLVEISVARRGNGLPTFGMASACGNRLPIAFAVRGNLPFVLPFFHNISIRH